MPARGSLRRVRRADRLYRKLNPGQWDPTSGAVAPAAFRDQYERQSFFVARLVEPAAVLGFFCRFPFARRFAREGDPTARDLFVAAAKIVGRGTELADEFPKRPRPVDVPDFNFPGPF